MSSIKKVELWKTESEKIKKKKCRKIREGGIGIKGRKHKILPVAFNHGVHVGTYNCATATRAIHYEQ